uniref:Variant surface glycoprotein 1125.3059 n=1 Tax=Trypanosoma brucei TaxID=5691 RepID=A0A1J0R9G8_9TRYP|nr:variant surface glycoprotein 1125.3059 [Trypanosoma brucei]
MILTTKRKLEPISKAVRVKNIQWATATSLLSLTILEPKEEYKVCSTPCSCATRLEEAAAHYSKKLSSNINGHKEQVADYTRLLVAAISDKIEIARKVQPVLPVAWQTIEEWDQEVRTGEQALTEGMKLLLKSSAKLRTLAKRLNVKHTLKISANTGHGRFTQSSFEETPVTTQQSLACQTAEDKDETTFDPEQPENKNTVKEFDKHDLITVTCQTTSAAGTNCQSASPQTGGGFIQFAFHKAINADSSKPVSRWSTNNGGDDVVLTRKVNITEGTADQSKRALNLLKSSVTSTACAVSLRDFNAMASKQAFRRQAIRTFLAIPDNEQTEPSGGQKLQEALDTAYGKEGADFKTTFWQAVEQTKADFTKNKQRIDVDIKPSISMTLLTEALSRWLGEMTAKKQKSPEAPVEGDGKADAADKAENKKDGDSKAATANFTSHSTQDAYTKGQNCKWENNACKYFSILANKQFVLMVSASVALLF